MQEKREEQNNLGLGPDQTLAGVIQQTTEGQELADTCQGQRNWVKVEGRSKGTECGEKACGAPSLRECGCQEGLYQGVKGAWLRGRSVWGLTQHWVMGCLGVFPEGWNTPLYPNPQGV